MNECLLFLTKEMKPIRTYNTIDTKHIDYIDGVNEYPM